MIRYNRTVEEFFTEDSKLSDIVESNYMLLTVIERVGIPLGFRDETIGEACAKYGIRPAFFLLLCNLHTYDRYDPGEEVMSALQLHELIEYLHNSHVYYLQKQIPRLKTKLEALIDSCSSPHSELLRRFFESYNSEIEKHFSYEECTVFPYVSGIESGREETGYSIDRFEENHDNIDEKLDDLKNIIMKYLPPECNEDMRTEVLFDLFRLGEDLKKHTMLEDRILIPLVSRLEKGSS